MQHIAWIALLVALAGCFGPEEPSRYELVTSQCVGSGPPPGLVSVYGVIAEKQTYDLLRGFRIRFYTHQGEPPLSRDSVSDSNGCYNVMLENTSNGGFYGWSYELVTKGYEGQPVQSIYISGQEGNLKEYNLFLEKT